MQSSQRFYPFKLLKDTAPAFSFAVSFPSAFCHISTITETATVVFSDVTFRSVRSALYRYRFFAIFYSGETKESEQEKLSTDKSLIFWENDSSVTA
jgi:hypothetical protein